MEGVVGPGIVSCWWPREDDRQACEPCLVSSGTWKVPFHSVQRDLDWRFLDLREEWGEVASARKPLGVLAVTEHAVLVNRDELQTTLPHPACGYSIRSLGAQRKRTGDGLVVPGPTVTPPAAVKIPGHLP
ncbi:hypothetical protein P7K49_009717 [Saguinus oedipus]|uniref:Uncharacterized protein n=1 Tax=Saguinus oedipus TaxID=9490 RepID=A0ABQ9VLE8_SAGOE|nr:hypothetical protein P7K49_009717 [Saguinus oedipus]